MVDKVLIIIVTYNAMKWVHKCFQSIYNSTIPLDVYVIDNGSSDGTQEYIKENYSQVRFYQSFDNLGFGRANNIGLKFALDKGYDYVYLLNQDAWIMPNTIETLIHIHKRNSEYGILSPFQLQGNEQRLDKNFVSYTCRYESNSCLLDDLYFKRLNEVYSVPVVMAAHWLISKDCLKKVGGFSPSFPHYGEDDNYANRVSYHGFKIGIVPQVVAIHDREDRVQTQKQLIYRSYICSLVILSDICKVQNNRWIKVLYYIFMSLFKYKSILAIKYLAILLFSSVKIRKNREISKKRTAFLSC